MNGRSPSAGLSVRATTTDETVSPYQWALPPNVEVEPDPLQLRLDFHAETLLLTDYSGPAVRVRRVSAVEVAQALAGQLDLGSSLLPPGALWWSQTRTASHVAVWREARVWVVSLRDGPDTPLRRLRLPMPALVFVCAHGHTPFVFAAKRYPRSEDDQLHHCPTPTVFPTGRICPGTETFPADPAKVPEAFFHSAFSPHLGQGKSHRYPDDVGRLWAELRGHRHFPLDDLVPHLRVGDAMRLGD